MSKLFRIENSPLGNLDPMCYLNFDEAVSFFKFTESLKQANLRV